MSNSNNTNNFNSNSGEQSEFQRFILYMANTALQISAQAPDTSYLSRCLNGQNVNQNVNTNTASSILAQPGDRFTATLTGYISRRILMDGNKNTVPHYISVTKSTISDEFFLSDDLEPTKPKNLGSKPMLDWPTPYILFFTIGCNRLDSWYSVEQELDMTAQKPKQSKSPRKKRSSPHSGTTNALVADGPTTNALVADGPTTTNAAKRTGKSSKAKPNKKVNSAEVRQDINDCDASDDNSLGSRAQVIGMKKSDWFNLTKMLKLSTIKYLHDYFDKFDQRPDGSCGYHGYKQALLERGIPVPDNMNDQRKEMYDFAMERRKIGKPTFREACLRPDGEPNPYVMKETPEHDYQTRNLMKTDWVKQVWDEKIDFTVSVDRYYWLDSKRLFSVLALKYMITFVCYDLDKHTTDVYLYEEKDHTVIMHCGKRGTWYMPPIGAICLLFEDDCHYQYLRPKPTHADKMNILSNAADQMRKRHRERKNREGSNAKKTARKKTKDK